MGIKDLPKQLKESGHFRQVEPSEFQGLRLGVDGMVWLHRAVSMASTGEDYCRLFHAEPQVPFYEALFRLLSDELRFWQDLNVTVILVLDGKENPIKGTEDRKRMDRRKKQVDALKAYLASGESSGRKKLNGLAKDACHVTREVVAYFLQWAEENTVQVRGAPMEAEHELVHMQRSAEIDWIYTVDSDVLPLGATNVIYKVERGKSKFKVWAFTHTLVVHFFETEVMKVEGSFLLEDFVAYCIFLGCDYCDRIKGVGPVALNQHFKKVWADKSAAGKRQLLFYLEAHGKFAFDAAVEGDGSTVSKSAPAKDYRENFSEAFAGLTSPCVASREADERGHSVFRMPFERPAWHVGPGYEDTDITSAFGEEKKMSKDSFTLRRWARYPDEDYLEWLPKYTEIDGETFAHPVVSSLPQEVQVQWYWKKSVQEYLQLRGYSAPSNANTAELNALVVQARNLPLVPPEYVPKYTRSEQHPLVRLVSDALDGLIEKEKDGSLLAAWYQPASKKWEMPQNAFEELLASSPTIRGCGNWDVETFWNAARDAGKVRRPLRWLSTSDSQGEEHVIVTVTFTKPTPGSRQTWTPWWNEDTEAWSKRLWPCTAANSRELQPAEWSESQQKTASNSWFRATVKEQGSEPSLSQPLSELIVEKLASSSAPEPEKKKTKVSDQVPETTGQDQQRPTDGEGGASSASSSSSSAPRPGKKTKVSDQPQKTTGQDLQCTTDGEGGASSASSASGSAPRPGKKRKAGSDSPEESPVPMRSRRIRIFPTDEQKPTLKQWLCATRYVYNKCVEISKAGGKLDKKSLREAIGEEVKQHSWLGDVPYKVRDNAIRDFDKARSSHSAKQRKAQASNPAVTLPCSFKYRSRRDKQQSLAVDANNWGRTRGMFASLFGHKVLECPKSESLPEKLRHEFRVIRDRLDHYYVCLPEQVAIRDENQAPTSHHSVVSLDPGVRTFQTCYDADGQVMEWGEGDMERLYKHIYCADRLQKLIAKTTHKSKKRKRVRAWHRKLQRIQNLVNEVHKKLSTWLCRNYRVILIPKFESSRMVRRCHRKLTTKTARGMLNWAHYRFRQRLVSKAELYPWCQVILCDEPYTSKTCGQCGELHHKLGSSKTFKCPKCGYHADRDASAARNILLRFLTINC